MIYTFAFSLPMSLNIPITPTSACSKPYTLNLQDCLACSSCITSSEKETLTQPTTIKGPTLFFITPHSKLNLFQSFSHKDYRLFENALSDFNKHNNHFVVDVSNYYTLLYRNRENKIQSSCPGVVKYLQRKNKHIDKLMQIKSIQQICIEIYKDDQRDKICVGSCLDKKMEGIEVMTTVEYHHYLVENGFIEFMQNKKYIDEPRTQATNALFPIEKTIDVRTDDIYSKSVHETVQFDEDFISDAIGNSYQVNYVNENFVEYTKGDKKYAKISGMVNFFNGVGKCEKYDFIECYVCESGCINGPGQLKNGLTQSLEFMQNFKIVNLCIVGFEKEIRREFEGEKNVKKTFKIEW